MSSNGLTLAGSDPWLVAVNAIIPALLAGNSVVLKHSPLTPLVGLRFAELFVEAGLPENVLQAVQMDPSTADLFVRSPEVDSVSFTGSVATGKLVNKAAADAGKLINVNLELGGNDPAYIRADADLSDAVENVIDGVVFNSGQSCCAVERIYVHEKVFEEFVKRAVETVEGYTLSDPLDGQTTLGPMTSEPLAAKVWEHIADALAKGANQLVDLSKFPKDKEGSVWIAPRIFVGLDNEMKIMSEETFGPVVGIVKVSSDEEAVRVGEGSIMGCRRTLTTRPCNSS